MNTNQALPPVRHSVVVEAPIARAFKVFTEDFGRFKPREHNLLAVPLAETVFEPRVGGHVYDRGVDGSECHWARVLAYEPPNRVLLSWDINPRWQIEPIPSGPASGKSGSRRRRTTGPGSISSTGNSRGTAKDGKVCATASAVIRAGHFTSSVFASC